MALRCCLLHLIKQNCLLRTFLKTLILMTQVSPLSAFHSRTFIFARSFFHNTFIFSGKYRTQLYDDSRNDYMPASPGIGMHVEVLDPEKKVILSKFYASEGRFTFTSHTPGEHHICLHTNSTRWVCLLVEDW